MRRDLKSEIFSTVQEECLAVCTSITARCTHVLQYISFHCTSDEPPTPAARAARARGSCGIRGLCHVLILILYRPRPREGRSDQTSVTRRRARSSSSSSTSESLRLSSACCSRALHPSVALRTHRLHQQAGRAASWGRCCNRQLDSIVFPSR